MPTRLGRPLPGQDLHLLDHRTFTAHVAQYTGLESPPCRRAVRVRNGSTSDAPFKMSNKWFTIMFETQSVFGRGGQ